MSYGEMAGWQSHFQDIADMYPELKDEFSENTII